MRTRSLLLILALVPLSLGGIAAHVPDGCVLLDDGGTPEDPADDVLTCTEEHYLSCEETVDPAGKVHDFFGTPTIPLTRDEPTESFTEGAGCGYPEDPIFLGTRQNTPFSMDFGGFVTTNVDTVTVELHDLGPHENAVYAANGNEVLLNVRLSVGGQNPLGTEEREAVDGTPSTSPRTVQIPIEAELSDTGLSTKYVFTVTNIAADLPGLLKEFDANGDGTPDPVFNQVLVTIEFPRNPVPMAALPSDNVAPVWGAVEVPASITVNGDVVGTVVDATTMD